MNKDEEVSADNLRLLEGLSVWELSLTPSCGVCGWRKGGAGSWDGSSCRCGFSSPSYRVLLNAD